VKTNCEIQGSGQEMALIHGGKKAIKTIQANLVEGNKN